MLTRRHLLAFSALTGLVLAAGPRAWAQAASAPAPAAAATSFVDKLGTALVDVVNGPGSESDKRTKLAPLIDADVDVDGIARFCLGRFARTATPQQLTDYTRLFHDVLLNNITGKIGEFEGVTFRLTTTTQRGEDDMVGTSIKRPNQEPNNVQWVVDSVAGHLKIVDVIAEGTSLRVTQRSDYASYLSRNNNDVGALVNAMRKQLGQ